MRNSIFFLFILDSKEDSNIDETGNNSKASTNEDQIEDEFEEVIEWEDSDDYLLHLEDILTRIHTVYYDMADKVIKKSSAKSTESVQQTADEIPDLKKIIPYVKKKVLQVMFKYNKIQKWTLGQK